MTRSYHLAFYISGGFFACAACLGNLIQSLALKNLSTRHVLVCSKTKVTQLSESNKTKSLLDDDSKDQPSCPGQTRTRLA